MTEVRFESGRFFHIEDEDCAFWILVPAGEHPTEEALRKTFISAYVEMGGYEAGAEYLKAFYDMHDLRGVDNDVLEDCIFKDAEKHGEAELAESMAHFQRTMFYVHNGMCPPDGPVAWGDFN